MNGSLRDRSNAHRSGFVALIGRPNAGKSTLLNALIGEHLAAVSPKAQTTRHRIPGILTEAGSQIVFVDTPGLLDPAYPLQEAMLDTAIDAVDGVDVVYWLVDHDAPSDRERALLERLSGQGVALFLLLTKIDQVPAGKIESRAVAWAEIAEWTASHRVSAVTRAGLERLLAETRDRMPVHPYFYPEDQLTDLNLRFIASELVREACYRELGAELPYSTHVVVDSWEEPAKRGGRTTVRATIFVERESQKGMVIGEGGKKLKAIGIRARGAIERMLDGKVHLALWVKVRPKWSRREQDLRFFGYRR